MRDRDICRQCKASSSIQPCDTCFHGLSNETRKLWDKIDAVEKQAREILKRLDEKE